MFRYLTMAVLGAGLMMGTMASTAQAGRGGFFIGGPGFSFGYGNGGYGRGYYGGGYGRGYYGGYGRGYYGGYGGGYYRPYYGYNRGYYGGRILRRRVLPRLLTRLWLLRLRMVNHDL